MVESGLFGHTAVYHNATQSIYVYGGYELTQRTAGLSDRLYCLQMLQPDSVKWTRMRPTSSSQVLVLRLSWWCLSVCLSVCLDCQTVSTVYRCYSLTVSGGPG